MLQPSECGSRRRQNTIGVRSAVAAHAAAPSPARLACSGIVCAVDLFITARCEPISCQPGLTIGLPRHFWPTAHGGRHRPTRHRWPQGITGLRTKLALGAQDSSAGMDAERARIVDGKRRLHPPSGHYRRGLACVSASRSFGVACATMRGAAGDDCPGDWSSGRSSGASTFNSETASALVKW
jgi:hypothetical protein